MCSFDQRRPCGLLILGTVMFILTRRYTEPLGELSVAGDAVMPRSTYFVQECPTCGRNLQVRIEYLGKQVVCQHCAARFEACEPGTAAYPPSNSSLSLLQRAEELLQSTGTSGIGARGLTSAVAAGVMPSRPK